MCNQKIEFSRLLIIIQLIVFTIQINIIYSQPMARGMKPKHIPPIPNANQKGLGYNESWALIIGIDNYIHYQKLGTAVNGAKSLAKNLKEDFGFKPENVVELYNESAQIDSIEFYLSDYFRHKTSKDDRLLVYFAGHGETSYNKKVGYICPVGAQKDKYTTFISMRNLNEWNDLIKAKHIWYIFDSCFSGFAFARGALDEISETDQNYYKYLFDKKERRALTAGDKAQLAYDKGPGGEYSPFTYYLLEGLKPKISEDQHGIIHASKLGDYIKKNVSNYTKNEQNPINERLEYSDQGEFLLWRKAQFKKELPNLTLLSFQNNSVPLYRMMDSHAKRGKEYFLFIFWASWCAPCHTLIEKLNTESLPKNLKIITINLDLPDKNSDIQSARNDISPYNNDKFFNLFLKKNEQFNEIVSLIEGESLPKSLIVTKEKSIIHIESGYHGKEKYMNMVMENMNR